MAEVKIKRAIVKGVVEKAKTGVCLHCDSKSTKRGLCSKHYEQFRRVKAEQPANQRADWEVDQIREGNILNGLQIIEIRSENVFSAKTAS